MFKLNQQQMALLTRSSVHDFEDRMVRHLGERFPLRCGSMDSWGLLRLVQRGVTSAASHGITVEKDVRGFIELVCALGEGFDADPKLPWASEVLGKEGPKTPAAKVEQLRELASEHLAQTPTAPADEATRKEASAALTAPPTGGTEVQFSDRTPAGKPVAPCPGKPVKKRILPFSG